MSVCERRQLQEERRCCSGVECELINVGQRQDLMPELENTVELEIWGTRCIAGQEMDRWRGILEEVPKLPYLVH